MALFAIWLTALAPTVSRSMAALALPSPDAWCAPAPGARPAAHDRAGMEGMADMPGMAHVPDHPSMGGKAYPGERPASPAMDMDAACGYCTLFAQVPVLGGVLHVADVLPVSTRFVVPVPVTGVAPRVARRFAPPRGPPVGSDA